MISGTHWIATQLLRSDLRHLQAPAPRATFNPRPAGVIQTGSATQAVLMFLREQTNWSTHHEIVRGCSRTSRAVDAGLIYLRHIGLIESTSDESRNARYLRYRVIHKGNL